ncbi:MAG: DUF1987 domain-containing protein [Tenuifilaceae bacterium]|jgi:hypothetical protein|uniref:DUF1987 domain-containing protein n=1 Tax=Perlabentimonas gracilis TaxID=2715279 RepID=UPI00140AF3CF|nr:DUF1987 domain-containing protein [Perlabentimonas gracilis]MDX9770905.1 DUF1987 domain-containing protein [Tenuifilaceae bacterium]NHB69101.1 DUF1987 domain-containing protein [Perlabentimonas gracilis]
MSKLLILATDESPQIHFDPSRGIMDISGKSLPEDIDQFYKPLEELVKHYVTKPQKVTTVNFDMQYLNSASTKKVLEIVTHLEALSKNGLEVKINWYFDEYDEDMKEEGDEFARLTDIPLTLIPKKED